MDLQPLIQRRAEACHDLFEKFVATYPEDEWFENRQADFQLWSSGIGASLRGKASLDHRVKDHPKTRGMICDYLDGLKELLQRHLHPYQDGLAMVDSDDADHELFLDSTSDSFIESRLAVKSILVGLARISSNIRRAGTKFRFKAADDQLNESELQECERMYGLHIYRKQGSCRQKFRSQQKAEIQSSGPSADEMCEIVLGFGWITAVQTRLVKANLLRHNRILYSTRTMRNKSAMKSDERHTVAPATRTPELAGKGIVTKSPGQIQGTPKSKNGQLSESREKNSASMMQTATEIGSQYDENSAFKKPTPSAFTQGTRTGSLLEYPRCPKPTVDGMLRCPYCGDVLSYEYFKNKSRWRGHVAQDLLPYSCVVQDCHYLDEMYGTTAGLSDHILKEHSIKIWTCPHCNSLPTAKDVKLFQSEDDWSAHMSQTHGGSFPADQLSLLSKLSTRTVMPSLRCPLCQTPADEAASDIEHIAQCLHQFALLALPPSPDDGDDDVKSSSDCAVMIDENSLNSIEHPSSNEEIQESLYSEGHESVEGDKNIPGHAAMELTSKILLEVPKKPADDTEAWINLVSLEEPFTAAESELISEVESSALVGVTQRRTSSHSQDTLSSKLSSSSDEIDKGRIGFITFVGELLRGMVLSVFDRKEFFPDGLIETLVTDDAVIQQCGFVNLHDKPKEQELLRFITFEAKKVFVICLLTGFEGKDLHRAMAEFMKLGFNDSSLPVTDEIMPKIPFFGSGGVTPRRPWSHLNVATFRKEQWAVLAPVFSPFTKDMELQPQHILPFTYMSDEASTGSFDEVFQVTVHASHFQYTILKGPDSSYNVALTRKKGIYTGGNVILEERQWQRSVTAHREIGSLNHPHIIWFVAAITRGNERYLVHEWADAGNLWDYWKSHKRPVLSAGLIKAIIQQLRGLADALENLHNYRGGSYRHGDLKPHNILLVKGSTNDENPFDIGVLKLAGFDLAKHHHLATELRAPTSMRYSTTRYEPPEAVTSFNQGRSRRYDIWSMGCIILEFIIWVHFGYECLIFFRDRLVDQLGMPDPYYIIESTRSGRVAKVHPEVDIMMDVLAENQADANRSALGDLLQLVRTKLLVVNLDTHRQKQPVSHPTRQQVPPTVVIGPDVHDEESPNGVRADAKDLRDALDEIIRRGESNAQYWSTEVVRNKMVPSLWPPISKREPFSSQLQRKEFLVPGPYLSRQRDARNPTSLEKPSQDHQQKKLMDQLFSALVSTVYRRQFLPQGALTKLLNESRVRETLNEALGPHSDEKAEQVSKMICQGVDAETGLSDAETDLSDADMEISEIPTEPRRRSFQRIFATLVFIQKAGDIGQFIDENVTDSDLPLLRVPRSSGSDGIGLATCLRPDKRLQCCQQWTEIAIRDFEAWQWSMLTPFFSKPLRRNVKHYPLRDDTILPFVKGDDSALEFEGGFGSVSKVDIHPDNHNFGHDSKEPVTSFAIKRLRTKDRATFSREVEMLKKFSDPPHPHLISLLATYEQSGVFNLIFPWAEADLMKYWRTVHPRPLFKMETVLWVAEQCRGIADGVTCIHKADSSENLPKLISTKKFVFGFHGDIKPENVLWFRSSGASGHVFRSTLKLTDFGLADFTDQETMGLAGFIDQETKPASSWALSASYRAPESDLSGFQLGRAYDMWTLGCLYLEFITWLLGGWQLVNEFANRRRALDPMWSDVATDTFFELARDKDSKINACIKPVVAKFIQQLHSHSACSKFIHDFLNVIEFDLLVILENDPWTKGRINSAELSYRLANLVRRCHSDIGYACEPAPWLSL